VASDDVQFGTPEMGLGIITAAGGSQTIPRVIHRGYALDMLLTGRWVPAQEALKMKLVNRVVPKERLLPEAIGMAERLKRFDPEVLSRAKQAVTRGLDMSLDQGLRLERNLGLSLPRS
jgi:enoyl-CoA hydratase/carnithine racemase